MLCNRSQLRGTGGNLIPVITNVTLTLVLEDALPHKEAAQFLPNRFFSAPEYLKRTRTSWARFSAVHLFGHFSFHQSCLMFLDAVRCDCKEFHGFDRHGQVFPIASWQGNDCVDVLSGWLSGALKGSTPAAFWTFANFCCIDIFGMLC